MHAGGVDRTMAFQGGRSQGAWSLLCGKAGRWGAGRRGAKRWQAGLRGGRLRIRNKCCRPSSERYWGSPARLQERICCSVFRSHSGRRRCQPLLSVWWFNSIASAPSANSSCSTFFITAGPKIKRASCSRGRRRCQCPSVPCCRQGAGWTGGGVLTVLWAPPTVHSCSETAPSTAAAAGAASRPSAVRWKRGPVGGQAGQLIGQLQQAAPAQNQELDLHSRRRCCQPPRR